MKTLLFHILDLLGVNALFRRLNRGKIKVLLYHNVTAGGLDFDFAITPHEFDRQLRYLKSRYNVLGINQSGAWKGYRPDRVNVLLSFDDGFINNLEFAAPILARHSISAIFFLIADCLETGAPPAFAEKFGEYNNHRDAYRTVDCEGAKVLIGGGMTIGSHGLSHRDFSTMYNGEALAEASKARDRLEAMLGCEITLFAFPWGKFRAGQEDALCDIYSRIFLTKHGFCRPDDRVIPRNEVADGPQLRAAASGALDFARQWTGKT